MEGGQKQKEEVDRVSCTKCLRGTLVLYCKHACAPHYHRYRRQLTMYARWQRRLARIVMVKASTGRNPKSIADGRKRRQHPPLKPSGAPMRLGLRGLGTKQTIRGTQRCRGVISDVGSDGNGKEIRGNMREATGEKATNRQEFSPHYWSPTKGTLASKYSSNARKKPRRHHVLRRL